MLIERLAADERRSRVASGRSGRFDVNCWFSSITPVVVVFISIVCDDEMSSELALDPVVNKKIRAKLLHHFWLVYFHFKDI